MNSHDDDNDPLERLYVATDDDGNPRMDGEELDIAALREHLEDLADAAEAVDDLATEANNLSRTGLDETHLVALMVGLKPSQRSIRDVRAFLSTLQDIEEASTTRLLIRLLADLSDLTQTDAEEYLGELRELHERYPPEDDR